MRNPHLFLIPLLLPLAACTPPHQLQVAEDISRQVNHAITYQSDRDQYHVADYWVVSPVSGRGDCEDYALTKQVRLHAAGIPTRIGVCEWPHQPNHAVAVVTVKGQDYVLDSVDGSPTPTGRTLRSNYAIPLQAYGCPHWMWASSYPFVIHQGK